MEIKLNPFIRISLLTLLIFYVIGSPLSISLSFWPDFYQSNNVASPSSAFAVTQDILIIKDNLNHPSGVAVDGIGNIYAADTLNDRIVVFDPTGKLLESIGSKKLASDNNTESDKDKSGELNHPSGVAVDGIGNIYAADTLNDRIVVFDPTGKLLESIGSKKLASDNNTESDKDKSGELNHPSGVAVDGIGNIYAADTLNDRIVVFDPTGKLLESIGSKKLASDNNTESDKGEPGQFKHPFGIAVDNICNIYVADTLNDRTQKITKCIGHNLSVQLTESVGVDDGLVSVTTAKPTSVQLTESVGVDDGLVSVTTAKPTSVQLADSVRSQDQIVTILTLPGGERNIAMQLTESVGVDDGLVSVTTAKPTSVQLTESVGVDDGLVSVTTAKPTSVQLTESVGVDDGLVSVTTAKPTSVQLTESVGVDDGLVSVTTAKPTSVQLADSVRSQDQIDAILTIVGGERNIAMQLTESVGVDDGLVSVTTAKPTSVQLTESVGVDDGLVSVTTAKPTSVQLTESVGVDDGLVSVTTAKPTSVQLTESVGVDDGLVSVTTAKPTSVQLTE